MSAHAPAPHPALKYLLHEPQRHPAEHRLNAMHQVQEQYLQLLTMAQERAVPTYWGQVGVHVNLLPCVLLHCYSTS